MRISDLIDQDAPPDNVVWTKVPDLQLAEMATMFKEHTGVDGVIYLSTRQGKHGPRVKWFPKTAGRGPCLIVTLDNPPAVENKHLPKVVAEKAAGLVLRWVEKNRDKIVLFWNEGKNWSFEQVAAFLRTFQKL